TVGEVVKVDQRGGSAGVPGRGIGYFERRTVAVRAAVERHPKQVALGIGDQAAIWVGTVGAIEVDQYFQTIGQCSFLSLELEGDQRGHHSPREWSGDARLVNYLRAPDNERGC